MVKLINNTVAAMNTAAVAEGIVLARAAGLDLDELLEVIGAGSGASAMLDLKARADDRARLRALFKLEHMLKDVRHCLAEARALGRAARAGRGRRAALRARPTTRGLGERDFAAVVEAAEAAAAELMAACLRRPGAAAAAVAACAVLAWLPALGAGFVSDDFVLLRAAEAVESPALALRSQRPRRGAGSGHFYRPLWVLWNAGVLELFGDEPAPSTPATCCCSR